MSLGCRNSPSTIAVGPTADDEAADDEAAGDELLDALGVDVPRPVAGVGDGVGDAVTVWDDCGCGPIAPSGRVTATAAMPIPATITKAAATVADRWRRSRRRARSRTAPVDAQV